MDKNKWVMLFGIFVVVMIIIYVLYLRKDRKTGNGRLAADPPAIVSSKNIDSLMEECWNYQKLYLNLEKRYTAYRDVFCNDGILQYMQRLFGFCRYDIKEYSDISQFKLKLGDQLLGGLYNCINTKLPFDGKSFTVPSESRIETTREAYFSNIGIDVNAASSNEAVMNKLKDKIAAKRREIEAIKSNSNNAFYENLWVNTLASLEALILFYKKELPGSNDLSILKGRIVKLVGDAEEKLIGNGVTFSYYEELSDPDRDKYFILLKHADDVPAVLREKDNYIFYKGKLSEAKALD